MLHLCLLLVAAPPDTNLLVNPEFAFHAFTNSREANARSYQSGFVPGWDQDAYGDLTVIRATRQTTFRTAFPTDGVVVLHPGKWLYQLLLLPDVGLDHGDQVSLGVFGHQTAPDSLEASVSMLRIDSASGEWSPADFGASDQRTFPKHARGELSCNPTTSGKSGAESDFQLKVERVDIVGAFTENANTSTDQLNTIGLRVEFVNRGEADVYLYAPCLCAGPAAQSRLPVWQAMPTYYRGLPRTMTKLWRGEPLHLIAMGSSIDRGSANPPMYLYDEDPASETYKQPLSDREFKGELIGQPEWNDYVGWWQHWNCYTGRLRRALMREFDYPKEKLLLNIMACDGSSVSEAHSGLADYAELKLPPDPNLNGHGSGKTWQELYPALFARPEGPRPDLVIFGSGANEKIDGPAEIACFEGTIRWFQRHYPGTEFVFCMFQNRESYTPNTGMLEELALRYQIPVIDLGRTLSLLTRYCNSSALVPRDGHPQAACHEIWFRKLFQAFTAADPIDSGVAQLQLPERANPHTVGWEGEMTTYPAGDPRLRGDQAFIFDDTVVNIWANGPTDPLGFKLDGEESKSSRRRPMRGRDVRNSTYAIGRTSLGERHLVEVTGEAKLVAVDAKTVATRRLLSVDNPRWELGEAKPTTFESAWGAPYGTQQVLLAAGASAGLDVVATALSICWVDRVDGGTLRVVVDDQPVWDQPTAKPFTTATGEELYFENRKGVLGLPWGLHRLTVTAVDGPVSLLGVFSYDTRSNREHERVLTGYAAPGETVLIAAPFAARPVVVCSGGLTVQPVDIAVDRITFGGNGPGTFEFRGE